MKKLRIKLNYLASTYGLDLRAAYLELAEDGTYILVLEGEKHGNQ